MGSSKVGINAEAQPSKALSMALSSRLVGPKLGPPKANGTAKLNGVRAICVLMLCWCGVRACIVWVQDLWE